MTQAPLSCTAGLKDLVRWPSCDVSVTECNFHSAPSRNHFSIPQGYATIVISNFHYITLDRKRWSKNKPTYPHVWSILSIPSGLCLNSCLLRCSGLWPAHITSPREWRHKQTASKNTSSCANFISKREATKQHEVKVQLLASLVASQYCTLYGRNAFIMWLCNA